MKRRKRLLSWIPILIVRKQFRSLQGPKPEKDSFFVILTTIKFINSTQHSMWSQTSVFGFTAASAVLAASKQVLTWSLPQTVLVQYSQGATQGLNQETGKWNIKQQIECMGRWLLIESAYLLATTGNARAKKGKLKLDCKLRGFAFTSKWEGIRVSSKC